MIITMSRTSAYVACLERTIAPAVDNRGARKRPAPFGASQGCPAQER